jgi:hypothetical protein
VVDVATQNTMVELGMLLGLRKPLRTLVVVEEAATLPPDVANLMVVQRTRGPLADQPAFLQALERWFQQVADEIRPALEEEPLRLLNAREYRAAVIAAITHLESFLRLVLEKEEPLPGRAYSLGLLSELAAARGLLLPEEQRRLREWMRIRNMVVHSQESVTRAKATEIVTGVLAMVQKLRAAR